MWLDVIRVSTILISFWQIATALSDSTPNVPWPINLSLYYENFDFINLDVLDMTGLACGVKVTHASKLHVSISVISLLLFTSVLMHFVIRKTSESKLQSQIKSKKLYRAWAVALAVGFDLVDNDDSHSIDATELAELLRIIHSHQHNENIAALEMEWGSGKKGKVARAEAEAIELVSGFGTKGHIQRSQFVQGMMEHPSFKNNTAMQLSLVRWTHGMAAFTTCTAIPAQIAFIIHAPISKTAFQWLNCRWVGNRAYVIADYATQCYTDEYNSTTVLAILIIVCFSVGVPLLISLYLYKERDHLHSPRVKARIGWLYSRYRVGCEWWQLHELLRKLFLCSVLMFVSPDPLRIPCAIVVCIFAIVSLNLYHPHKNNVVFKVAEIAFCATAIQFVGGLSLKATRGNETWSKYVGWFLVGIDIGINIAVFVAIMLLMKFLRGRLNAEETVIERRRTKRFTMLLGGSAGVSGFLNKKAMDEIALENT